MTLTEALVAELERPRNVTAQVANHVIGTYGISRDKLGEFFEKMLPELQEYEIDLVFAPMFTPSLRDQSVFAGILGRDSFPSAQWPDLIQQLAARPTVSRLVTDDNQSHLVPLREVTIERYVRRLRLDGTISEALFGLIENLAPAAERDLLKAIARRAIWETSARREILSRYLNVTLANDSFQIGDAQELLKLMETYEPADTKDLLSRIPHWQQVLRQEINDAGSKPFFNERVQDLHGGGRDQRRRDDSRVTAKENERAFLERLQNVLNES